MRNRLLIHIFAVLALATIPLISGCGSAKKEGAADPLVSASRIDNFNCTSTCHAATVSAVASSTKDLEGRDIPIPQDWAASKHATANAADCQDCHGGGSLHWGLGPIPTPNPDTSLTCTAECHANMPPPHFNNITSGAYPASFVSSREVGHCRNCHNPHNPTTQMPVNIQWAESGHGDVNATPWTDRDFKTTGHNGNPAISTASDCVRCHTTTGYINYVTSNFANVRPWGVASDKTKEVLQCNACHDKSYDFSSRRSVAAVTGFYNYSAAAPINKRLVNFPFPDVKTSNICMACHTGRESGRTIQAIAPFANFSSLSFVNSHYLTAGATVFKASGYEYAGQDYTNPLAYIHDQIGLTALVPTVLTGSEGPCASCHMDTAGGSGFDRHTFLPVTKLGDPARINDNITAIVTPLCVNCHAGAFTPDTAGGTNLQTFKTGYNAALAALAEALKQKGFEFQGGYPYFSGKNWAKPYGKANGANTMGAAFNFNVLRHDYGGFAHNDVYVKRLIIDSIDFIVNGAVTPAPGPAVAALINGLPDDAALKYGLDGSTVNFNAAMKTNAINWLGAARP